MHLFRNTSLWGIVAQVVQHGLVGLGHRPPQFTGLVKIAKADFLLPEAKGASRDYRGGLLCQRLGLDGIRKLFASEPCHFSIQSCDNREQPLHPLCGPFTGWESQLLGILVPEEAFSQRPIKALHDALVPVDVNPIAPNLDRVLC